MKRSAETLDMPQSLDRANLETLSRDELIRSNRELEQFAFAASHDLQEPLKTLSLYLQHFNRKYKGQLDDQGDEALSFMLDNTQRMQKLVQNLLNYALAKKENLQLKETDCNIALERAIKNLKITIEERSAQISHESCPVVMGDEIQLTQLFQNLISNAIKFSKKDTFPCIHISVKDKTKYWIFSVRDNGIGINPEQVQTIFDIFKRLHNQSEYPGSGIGLALCKRIVESHKGAIRAESEIGKGTTIYFTIAKIKEYSLQFIAIEET